MLRVQVRGRRSMNRGSGLDAGCIVGEHAWRCTSSQYGKSSVTACVEYGTPIFHEMRMAARKETTSIYPLGIERIVDSPVETGKIYEISFVLDEIPWKFQKISLKRMKLSNPIGYYARPEMGFIILSSSFFFLFKAFENSTSSLILTNCSSYLNTNIKKNNYTKSPLN